MIFRVLKEEQENSSFFFFLIDNMEIFIKSELHIVHKACTIKQEQVTSS